MILQNKKNFSNIRDLLKKTETQAQKKELMLDFIQTILTEFLGLPEKGKWEQDDNFFDEGMDSLLSTQLKITLQKKLEILLETSVLYQYPTVNELVDYLIQKIDEV